MSWVRIWVHVVFTTRKRHPHLHSVALRRKVFAHIRQNAVDKGISLEAVGGYHDHVHCLLCLGKQQTISKVVQLIKGESSAWINKQELTRDKFHWQDGFWAVGVSESGVGKVRNYILRQEWHHGRFDSKRERGSSLEEEGLEEFPE